MAVIPTAVYGVVLLMAGVGYYVLQYAIVAQQGPGSPLACESFHLLPRDSARVA